MSEDRHRFLMLIIAACAFSAAGCGLTTSREVTPNAPVDSSSKSTEVKPGNVIPKIEHGANPKLVGALIGTDDILPGSEATHMEVFSVPPPRTKYLVLTVDLASFGGEGKAAFKIPVERIANFPK